MAKVFVTGSSGLLGAHVVALLSRNDTVTAFDRNPWWGDTSCQTFCGDIGDEHMLRKALHDSNPDIIVHCAAMTTVDDCEANPTVAYDANVGLPRRIIELMSPSTLFVYISTDAVFDGSKQHWMEEDTPNPINVYGRTKLQGEQLVAVSTARHLIVRTNFYGWSSGRKESAGEWLYRALEQRKAITLYDDYFFTAMYVVDLVYRLDYLMKSGKYGVFHLAGSNRVSKYSFGKFLANAEGFSMENVKPGSIVDAKMFAPRPRDISLDGKKFEQFSGLQSPSCLEGISRFLKDRELSLSSRFRVGSLAV